MVRTRCLLPGSRVLAVCRLRQPRPRSRSPATRRDVRRGLCNRSRRRTRTGSSCRPGGAPGTRRRLRRDWRRCVTPLISRSRCRLRALGQGHRLSGSTRPARTLPSRPQIGPGPHGGDAPAVRGRTIPRGVSGFSGRVMRPGFVGGSRVTDGEWSHGPTQEQRTPVFW